MAQQLGEMAGIAAKALSEPIAMAQKAAKMLAGDMDATQLLKEDHTKAKALFAAYRATGERALGQKAKLFEQIEREVSVHAQIEEEIFYPAVKRLRGEASEHVAEATEEHSIVKKLLSDLGRLEPGTEQFEAKIKVMIESVLHHASEEEREMFPIAKKGLGDQLKALGKELDQRKHELLGRRTRRKAG